MEQSSKILAGSPIEYVRALEIAADNGRFAFESIDNEEDWTFSPAQFCDFADEVGEELSV